MKRKTIHFYAVSILLLLLLCPVTATAQTVKGRVYSLEKGKKLPLPGASVYFANETGGAVTDGRGAFQIEKQAEGGKYLIAGLAGFTSDSVWVTKAQSNLEFVLVEDIELQEVVISKARQGTVLSRLTIGKTELITSTGMAKMACCNLSESFENSATVTVGFTDAVSGTKQVQLLGLPGIYSQLLAENVPNMRGLLSPFGWGYIPGSWMESIQVSKGASSVVNGYESVAGQINMELKKPNYTEPLFINAYSDLLGRYEANVTSATQVAKNLWTGLLLHGSAETGTHDYNGDTFSDMPESKLVNLYNRWFYLNESGIQSRTGIRFLYDNKEGGQHDAHFNNDDDHNHYQTHLNNRSFSVENKTGLTVGSREGQSLGIISSFTSSEVNLNYGKKSFRGTQNSFYGNAIFTSGFNDAHRYTAGVSFVYDDYGTDFLDSLSFNLTPRTPLNRREAVSGIFAEYTFSIKDRLDIILGLREDYNSRYGWLFTPRANLRYSIIEELVFRASAGKGYRSPNVIVDNIGLLATSRKFNLDEINGLNIESAWNYGGNISAYIPVWDKQILTISADYFHTQFQNQAVIDMERDHNSVYFYNHAGTSSTDVWQVDFSLTPFKGFDLFAAFRYNDTKITYSAENGQRYVMEKPLISRYRGLVNLAYATPLRKWVFDFTAQINGPSRIPGLNGYDSQVRYSEQFPIYFAQVTKNTKRFDIYAGSENILDFKQTNPILNADNPFGRDFDSSLVWGPVVGRKIYAGIRWRIGKLP
ncbi:MAG: TonB-dependent receptor [Dysgonamonadaceae bacterium]|nr:TonB-dependent receptor [Dysgonamonadaceae bacterium]